MINKAKSLTPDVYHVLIERGTEPPHSGLLNLEDKKGTYLCRLCGKALFRGEHKFISSCGWPSFDDEIEGSLLRVPDPDGKRYEIRCQRCQGHLGHVFLEEGFTQKNLRHCVNSLSLDFVHDEQVMDTQEVIVAGGCFWGLQHHLAKEKGVVFTEVGYIGGHVLYPSYAQVCEKNTGHYEAIRLLFDSSKTDVQAIYRAFFEWHDPCQENGQGPDYGPQYQSAIFVYDPLQEHSAYDLMTLLKAKGFQVVTQVLPMSIFWKAEEEHQNYLSKNPQGYCSHKKCKRF